MPTHISFNVEVAAAFDAKVMDVVVYIIATTQNE
jgi:hypothetical protein